MSINSFFFPHKGRGLTGPKFNLQHEKDHGHTGSIINNSHHLLVEKKNRSAGPNVASRTTEATETQ